MGPQTPAPAVDDDLMVLPESPDAWVVEARTGGRVHEVQLTPSGATHPSPTVADGRIHIGFRTFDLETGDLIWEYECDEPKYRIVKPGQEIVRSAGPSGRCPAVVDGTVFVAGSVRDGETRFVEADEQEGAVERSSVVAGNSSGGEFRDDYDEWGHLHALDAETGALRWEVEFDTPVPHSAPTVVADGSVYVVDADRMLRSFDASAGTVQWTVDLNGELSGTRPAIANGTVLVAAGDGDLLAFDAEHGERQWQFAAESALAGPPAVADGTVHVSDVDGGVYAVSPSGDTRWQFDVGATLNTGPVVAHGRLYVAGRELHCLARRD
ncbi:PQQ-binding-like beta-propeller repeat protein [Halosimplex litoreum]|nr:PQQ-binding-like beta-propeller repeat protein [Halosimplex litoreum]